jgi:hypothetical protein
MPLRQPHVRSVLILQSKRRSDRSFPPCDAPRCCVAGRPELLTTRSHHDEPPCCRKTRTRALASPIGLGDRCWRSAGCVAPRVLVARPIDCIRVRPGADRRRVHRFRRSRWTPGRPLGRDCGRDGFRHRRRRGCHRLTVAARRGPRGPWTQGPVAAPPAIRREHALVAALLRRGRRDGGGDSRSWNRRRRAIPSLTRTTDQAGM